MPHARPKIIYKKTNYSKHLTLLQVRCVTLLYFAIRLESRKSANKRIYLN